MSTPPPPTSAPAGSTGIEITASFFILSFILFLFKPVFVIDGTAVKSQWKTPGMFPTAPGQHQVQVHIPYLFLRTAGKAVATATVQPGQVVRVAYKAPWILFLPGKITMS